MSRNDEKKKLSELFLFSSFWFAHLKFIRKLLFFFLVIIKNNYIVVSIFHFLLPFFAIFIYSHNVASFCMCVLIVSFCFIFHVIMTERREMKIFFLLSYLSSLPSLYNIIYGKYLRFTASPFCFVSWFFFIFFFSFLGLRENLKFILL